MDNRTAEQVGVIDDDLADLERQVEAGEIDENTAAVLRSKYETQRERLFSKQEDESAAPSSSEESEAETRSRFDVRAITGVTIVLVALVTIAIMAVNSLTGPSTSGVQGLASDVVTGDGAVALSDVTNEEMEAVVAENPDVVGMRLALARRYFEEGDFEKALEHYFVILNIEKNPEALANVGWMTFVSGRADVALGYVEAALVRQPDSITAIWFLGNIQFSLGNYDDATLALVKVATADGVPENVKERAEDLLREMEGA